MRRTGFNFILCVVTMLGLSGCYGEQDVALPLPQELTRAAIGHYCGMIVADHVGPKAQIFVKGSKTPVWFASVRDAFTFMTLPGEAKNISAVYVNDMGGSANWKSPEAGTWIDARKAYFVLNSNRKGGMGLKETVPFSTSEAAATFATRHGGHVISFSKVPSDYVLGDDSMPVNDGPHIGHHGKMKKGGES